MLPPCLIASPVIEADKPLITKRIERFGTVHVSHLLFVHDGSSFHEPIFRACEIVSERGSLVHFFRTYLHPGRCAPYQYILPWSGDIDIDDFSLTNFLNIMERNSLDVAQPALSERSIVNHPITRKHATPVGRRTEFVEQMAQVFRRDAWISYWKLLEEDAENPYAWGYDFLCPRVCGMRVGIVDCETVTHLRKWSRDLPPDQASIQEQRYQKALRSLLDRYRVPADIHHSACGVLC